MWAVSIINFTRVAFMCSKLAFVNFVYIQHIKLSNPFIPNVKFLYPLKTENLEVFWYFQRL